jgi:hypothetical protein
MRRYLPNLLVALLTFFLGVFVSTSLRFFPHFTTVPSCGMERNTACNEWEKSGPAGNGLGWDLTYTSLLHNSGVCPGDLYCDIASTKPQPPVHQHFAEWKGDPIVSSILIELPDGHAAMFAMWFIRTKDQAYVRTFHPEQPTPDMQTLPTEEYDRAFEAMTCWQQDRPRSAKFSDTPKGDGYIGFLNLFKEGRSRQMLLSYRDFFVTPATADNHMDQSNWGRFWKILQPIYFSLENQRRQAPEAKN